MFSINMFAIHFNYVHSLNNIIVFVFEWIASSNLNVIFDNYLSLRINSPVLVDITSVIDIASNPSLACHHSL